MKKASIILLATLLLGCSTQKNTLLSRTYHNVTARYNYLFNAKESYNESNKKYSKDFPFAYNSQLPVFLFSDKQAPSKTSDGMDRAVLKSGMLIKYHSITVKPKNGKQETPSQRAFYNQREYCKYVDDAYLYIAKGNAYLHEYSKSRQAIDQILLNYPNTPSKIDAQIWQGAIAGAEGDLIQYVSSLNAASQLRGLSKQQQAFLNAAWADYYLKKNEPTKAIEHLEQAIINEGYKVDRNRYQYILGQLYQQNNQKQKAASIFHKVAKSTGSYEMAFNAQLEEAKSYTSGSTSELKSLLQKMARKERNSPYRDQIYYTIGKIYLQDKNEKEALDNFYKSLSYSPPISNQKGVTFATLADLAYDNKNFEQAQSYYDSATVNLDSSHPVFAMAQLRSQKLGRLVHNMREYQRLDSLLKMSEMSNADLNTLINKKIADLSRQQLKAQEEASTNRQYLMQQNNLSLSTSQAGNWYFYNQSTLAFGAAEFKMRWGQRKLEDNWRRKNKGTIEQQAEEAKEEKRKVEEGLSPLTKEFYLRDIPETAEQKKQMVEQKHAALIGASEAYLVDVKAPQEAIDNLAPLKTEKLSPINEMKAYSLLYQANLALSNLNEAQQYKNLVVSKYPQSEVAQSFASSTVASENQSTAASEKLKQCVSLLDAGKYSESLELANRELADSKNALAPQLALVRAMSIGGLQGRDAYRKELSTLISQYPNTEAAQTASTYIGLLDKQTLETLGGHQTNEQKTSKEDKTSSSVVTGYSSKDGAHAAIIIVPNSVNHNQLKFSLTSMNLEVAPNKELTITKKAYDSNNDIVVITPFENKKEALDYYYSLIQKQSTISALSADKFAIFAISTENLEMLLQDKTLEGYSDFFMSNYIQSTQK